MKRRRASVLLEMVLALAIFVIGAAMLSQLQTSVLHGLERARLSAEATDLARRTLAEIELGLVTIADLRTLPVRTEQSVTRDERREAKLENLNAPSPWRLDVKTERSPYAGLTLVEVTVSHVVEAPAPGERRQGARAEDDDSDSVRVTLRQLIRLRAPGEDSVALIRAVDPFRGRGWGWGREP